MYINKADVCGGFFSPPYFLSELVDATVFSFDHVARLEAHEKCAGRGLQVKILHFGHQAETRSGFFRVCPKHGAFQPSKRKKSLSETDQKLKARPC